MKQNIIIAMLSFIIFLLLRREQQPTIAQSQSKPHKDRTLEELSPVVAESVQTGVTLFDYPSNEVYAYVRKYVDKLMQPDLTLTERQSVKEELVNLFHFGRTYDKMRESKMEQQAATWLSEIEGDE